jgi:DNA/RNA endonuclease G (NUC1)
MMNRRRAFVAASVLAAVTFLSLGPRAGELVAEALLFIDLKPIVLDDSYQHDRFDTQPKDIVFQFRAYTTSFDGGDDDNGDGTADHWGIPEWVAYEMRAAPPGLGAAPARPSSWITDAGLHSVGIAPNDSSYRGSGYSRGHMCMKSHAWRMGADADWNTHTVLNAVPQLQCVNAGAWLQLEEQTGDWADDYGAVWIVCGPVIYGRAPDRWIGQGNEVKAAIPDAFFKIVVKEDVTGDLEVLSFLFPMEGVDGYCGRSSDLSPYLTSVDTVEALTGLNFLSSLDDDVEDGLESIVHTEIWTN